MVDGFLGSFGAHSCIGILYDGVSFSIIVVVVFTLIFFHIECILFYYADINIH